ncbi:MAG: AIR synthase family protein [Clostridia bacterium]
MMDIGKLSNELLQKIILDKIENKRPESVLKPGIGEDACVLDLDGELCVLSSDPITGAVQDIGSIAVHVSLNDIAASGAVPIGIITTILLPPGSQEKELEALFHQISRTCKEMGVEILGGHTEVTDAVNRVVVATTAVGKVKKGKMVSTGNAQSGDSILITKDAATEGTAILAGDHWEELEGAFGKDFVKRAQSLIQSISVVREGIIGTEAGVHAMHDVTEGGVLGAVWEMCTASGKGCIIEEKSIPLAEETLRICAHFGIDPLKLISSGSMLMSISPCNEPILARALADAKIPCRRIGVITESGGCLIRKAEGLQRITPPESDELYKVRRKGT